jgi:DNA repair ATPase RecN
MKSKVQLRGASVRGETVMTKEQEQRLREIVSELETLVSEARLVPSSPMSKEALADIVTRATTLAKAVEELAGDEKPIEEFTRHLAEARQLIDHWDELMPVWQAREKLSTLLETLPHTPESVPTLLAAARELRAELDKKAALLPPSYAQPQIDLLNQLLASVPSGFRDGKDAVA